MTASESTGADPVTETDDIQAATGGQEAAQPETESTDASGEEQQPEPAKPRHATIYDALAAEHPELATPVAGIPDMPWNDIRQKAAACVTISGRDQAAILTRIVAEAHAENAPAASEPAAA